MRATQVYTRDAPRSQLSMTPQTPNTYDLHTVDVCSQSLVAHPKAADSRASRKEIHLHAHATQSRLAEWKDRQEVASLWSLIILGNFTRKYGKTKGGKLNS